MKKRAFDILMKFIIETIVGILAVEALGRFM